MSVLREGDANYTKPVDMAAKNQMIGRDAAKNDNVEDMLRSGDRIVCFDLHTGNPASE